ncbi:lycopene cyclase domain-containing protein [Pedobacter sp. Du54]|uniref:lycopene cyclase domain-containing protein n=1 Tax=Pedobacter anseongensis TaxID=3133439 RepID=UPI0030A18323
MKYAYLLVNFFTIIVPFLFSFHPKLKFYKTWKAFFPAVICTSFFFIVWDAYFTDLGVWGFNSDYLVGVYLYNLPLEEILFFLCIPYACVFTYHCIDLWLKEPKTDKWISLIFIIACVFMAILNFEKAYTMFAFLTLGVLLLIAKYVMRVDWLIKFYLIYCILLFPFLIVNGVLTGTGIENPIVWYNENEIIGCRILTIPFEDVFYGMAMVLMNLLIYKTLLKRDFIKL